MKPRPFHHQRPLAVFALAFGVGVWAGVRLAWRPWLYVCGLAAAVGVCLLLPRLSRKRVAGALAAALFLGMLLGGWKGHPALPEEGKYRVEGVAAADLVLREDGRAAGYLEQVVLTDEAGGEYRLSRVYWTYYPDAEEPFLPREGERAVFTGKVYHPSGQENPYGFDFRLYLLTRGICVGVSGASDAQVSGHPGRGLSSLTYHARQALGDRLKEVFGEGSALPLALLIGQRDELPQETTRGFSDAGISHLLAVSGLHVGLLAAVVMLPLRRLTGVRTRLWVLAGFLLMYCALLDFSAPVVRASLLMVMAQARRIVRKMGDPLTTLAAAFLLILIVNPLALFTVSLQMSFCAVLGIVLIKPSLDKRLNAVRPRFLRDGIGVTLSATAGVALPTIQVFHRLSVVGIVINPLLCGLFSVLLPLYALTLILGCLYLPAGQAVAAGLNAVSRCLTDAVEKIGALPFATVRLPFLPWYCLGALALAAVLCTRYCVIPRKRRLLAGAAAVAAAFGVWRLSVSRDVRYVQLSVGQEDAALILDGRDTTVIDTGEYGGDVASFLLSAGRQADRVILTHLHRDHCLGLRQLIDQRVPIRQVLLPQGAEELMIDEECRELMAQLRALGIPVEELRAGDTLQTENVTMEVTWPWDGTVRPGADPNRYSLCMLMDLDGVTLLTAGDLEGEYEKYAARDADLLKAAHHGSKTSTGEAFLTAVTPEAVLISASKSSAALPHPDMLERLSARGIPVYVTGQTGAVIITCREGSAFITTYLNE